MKTTHVLLLDDRLMVMNNYDFRHYDLVFTQSMCLKNRHGPVKETSPWMWLFNTPRNTDKLTAAFCIIE
jgi:hypothetical protein